MSITNPPFHLIQHRFLRRLRDLGIPDVYLKEIVHGCFEVLTISEMMFRIFSEAFLLFFCEVVLTTIGLWITYLVNELEY